MMNDGAMGGQNLEQNPSKGEVPSCSHQWDLAKSLSSKGGGGGGQYLLMHALTLAHSETITFGCAKPREYVIVSCLVRYSILHGIIRTFRRHSYGQGTVLR